MKCRIPSVAQQFVGNGTTQTYASFADSWVNCVQSLKKFGDAFANYSFSPIAEKTPLFKIIKAWLCSDSYPRECREESNYHALFTASAYAVLFPMMVSSEISYVNLYQTVSTLGISELETFCKAGILADTYKLPCANIYVARQYHPLLNNLLGWGVFTSLFYTDYKDNVEDENACTFEISSTINSWYWLYQVFANAPGICCRMEKMLFDTVLSRSKIPQDLQNHGYLRCLSMIMPADLLEHPRYRGTNCGVYGTVRDYLLLEANLPAYLRVETNLFLPLAGDSITEIEFMSRNRLNDEKQGIKQARSIVSLWLRFSSVMLEANALGYGGAVKAHQILSTLCDTMEAQANSTKQRKEYEKAMADLSQDLLSEREIKADLEKQLEKAKCVRENNAALKTEIAERDMGIEELRAQFNILRKKLSDTQANLQKSASCIQRLEGIIKSQSEELEKLRAENKSLTSDLLELEEALTEKKSETENSGTSITNVFTSSELDTLKNIRAYILCPALSALKMLSDLMPNSTIHYVYPEDGTIRKAIPHDCDIYVCVTGKMGHVHSNMVERRLSTSEKARYVRCARVGLRSVVQCILDNYHKS